MNCLFSGLFLLKIIIEASTNIQLSIQESSGMKFALLDHRWKVLPGACGLHEQRCRFRHTPDGTSKSTSTSHHHVALLCKCGTEGLSSWNAITKQAQCSWLWMPFPHLGS